MGRMLNFVLLSLFFLTQVQVSAQQKYSSDVLKIEKIADKTFVHRSYLSTENSGKVACNGLIVLNKGEAVIFDTPPDSAGSMELINYVRNQLNAKIVKVIPTHFHHDCLGGLEFFHAAGIQSLAHDKTKEMALVSGVSVPQEVFTDEYMLNVGSEKILLYFAGEGHTQDNILGYVLSDKVLFGGCLVKTMNAGKGNLEDANTADWPATIERIKVKFPKTKFIVPGHGKWGNQELLSYTAQLFRD